MPAVSSIIKYSSECQAITSKMKRRFPATDISFYRRLLRILWTENVSNKYDWSNVGTKMTLLFRIRKKQYFNAGVRELGEFDTLTA